MPAPIGRVPNQGLSNDAIPGLLLLDSARRPLYYNAEAVRILARPAKGNKSGDLPDLLPAEILSRMLSGSFSDPSCASFEFVSGKARYSCRTFAFFRQPGKPSRTITGILIEPVPSKPIGVLEVAERFRLSKREGEVVSLLTLGLTSKEIAGRMKVSPNTVKTFFRLIMTKMAVSTRSGIVGKLLQS